MLTIFFCYREFYLFSIFKLIALQRAANSSHVGSYGVIYNRWENPTSLQWSDIWGIRSNLGFASLRKALSDRRGTVPRTAIFNWKVLTPQRDVSLKGQIVFRTRWQEFTCIINCMRCSTLLFLYIMSKQNVSMKKFGYWTTKCIYRNIYHMANYGLIKLSHKATWHIKVELNPFKFTLSINDIYAGALEQYQKCLSSQKCVRPWKTKFDHHNLLITAIY